MLENSGAVLISPDTTISLERTGTDPLLQSLRPYIAEIAAGVRSGIGLPASVQQAGEQFPGLSVHFVIEEDLSSFGLKNHHLFPEKTSVEKFGFVNRATGQRLVINDLLEEEVREIGNTLHILSTAEAGDERIRTLIYPELMEALRKINVYLEDSPVTNWNLPTRGFGIVRLQHASFILQTPTARVLVDPHFVSEYSSGLPTNSFMSPYDFNRLNIDAVLISHSHSDHYHLPSLMMLPRDILMIAPKINEETILGPRIANELRSIGFTNVMDPEWYSGPIAVHDIEIWPLPFYGEQPLRYEHPRDRRLRNWGNSYLFRTAQFSAWCLIDSGSDAEGSMLQVAEHVRDRFGSLDVLMSNLHDFHVGAGRGNPYYTMGGGQYWLALTADQLSRFPTMSRDLITLGPHGVAEVCALVDAKYFLPYAHLWSEVGTIPPDEWQMLVALDAEPAFGKCRTRIENWQMGDVWRP